jgi:ATPase subunit of ABC transporter with duplicated ATPase domains
MITINNLTVHLGGRPILSGASAAIPKGARVGLIGRNGAGKSTLMKVLIGQIDTDGGSVDMPRRTRIGYIAQDAPSGLQTPFEAVLAADTERAELLAQSENCDDPDRLGAVYERLLEIDAYTAPSRAARILSGLGFDEPMQAQPLDSFSGGWKMRVALASLLFSAPDVLLLDEPSNHLDLEATLWLENFLKAYAGTLIVISHERDLLNNVVDTIVHLQGGKLTLYPGSYDDFEKQRAERAAHLAAAKAAQEAQAARLQDYVARNSARASTAKQAQSRAKMLAKMQPIAALIEDPSLSFGFPNPDELRPPLIQLEHAAVGYGEEPVLQRLDLRIDPTDRIALLGRNGNGKTTLARLLAAQLVPMNGAMQAPGKLKVGYFTQYQVEELASDATPLEHMTRAMDGATQARCGRSWGGSGSPASGRRRGSGSCPAANAPAGAGAHYPRRPAPAGARRAHQPPRRRCPGSAGPGAQRLRGRGAADQPRPAHGRTCRRPAGAGRWRNRHGICRQHGRLHRLRAGPEPAQAGQGCPGRQQGERQGARGGEARPASGAGGGKDHRPAAGTGSRDRPGDVRTRVGQGGLGAADDGRSGAATGQRDQGTRSRRTAVDRSQRAD